MKRIKIERVVVAVGRLQQVGLTRPGQWLPGFFCLKSHKLDVGNTVTLRGKDYVDFISQYYSVPSPPDPSKPFFDPLQTPPWKNGNWPQGTFHSRNDRSLLIAQGAIEVSPQAPERDYTLRAKYLKLLASYFESSKRIPLLDFTCWMLRNEPLKDEDTSAVIVDHLIQTLGLSKDDVVALFERGADEAGDVLFTDQNWQLEALTKYLPAPASQVANEAPASQTIKDDGAEDEPVSPADDETFVSALLAHLRDVDNFEVDASFLRAVLAAMRVDRFVILCGKPGTGKTEFVHALHRALSHVLRGSSEVFLVHHEIHPESAEWELVGARDLGGKYVPSPFIRDLTIRGSENDLHIVLLDEMNRGPVDSYAGRLLAAISNGVPLDLPGQVTDAGFPESGRWEPRPGVILFGAINSPLTEPSRLPLSGPVKRRAHLLPMPDLLEQLATAGGDVARGQFFDLCKRRLVPQLRRRLLRRGSTPSLDGDLDARLANPPSDDVLLHIWKIVVAVGARIEVAITLGVVQSIIAFVLASDESAHMEALDRAFVSKVVPHLQGDIGILDAIEAALGDDFPRSRAAIAGLRAYAEENGDRVSPMY